MLTQVFTTSDTPYGGRSPLWKKQMGLQQENADYPKWLVLGDEDLIEVVFPIVPDVFERYPKPRCRDDCLGLPRPCPYVSCWWHTYLDLKPNGEVVYNWGNRPVEDIPYWGSCVLDLADGGGIEEEELSEVLGMEIGAFRRFYESILRKLRHHKYADAFVGCFSPLT